jgi:UDP-3-O-[3-hydroxymyristoyl] glucosamine N-acyltransferase
MIVTLVEGAPEGSGLRSIRNRAAVDRSIRTGFPWSRGPLALCYAANWHLFSQACGNPDISAVITNTDTLDHAAGLLDEAKGVILCRAPDQLFYWLHNQAIHQRASHLEAWPSRIDSSATVSPSAVIAPTGVVVGARAEIGPLCVVYENSVIGDGTILHAACVIGAPGVFSKSLYGTRVHVRHFGGVQIGRDAVLHAGVHVARAVAFGESTTVGDQTHLGPRTSVGHDAVVGAGVLIAANVVLAWRAVVGEGAWLGAGAIVSNAITVGAEARVNLGAVVVADVPAGAAVSGNFAIDHARHLKRYLGDR